MKRKTLALLLAMIMLLTILAGCAKTETTTDQNDVQDTPAATDQQGAEDTTDTPDDAQTNEDNTNDDANTEEPTEVTYPLTEEPVTFTVWWPNELTSATNDYNDRIWFQTMEAKTGVHLDFSASPSFQAASESYNLMLVSGDVSDFVYQIYKYHLKGLDNAIEEEWYYDMVNYLDYMPNMKRVMLEDENRAMQAVTDSGYLAGLPMLVKDPQAWVNGHVIRQDLLDKYNVEAPTTIAELGDFLETCVANEETCANGALFMTNTCFTGLEASFDICLTNTAQKFNPFIFKDNKIQCSILQDGYRDYIDTLRDWYSRGLIDKDFGSKTAVLGAITDEWKLGQYAVSWDCFVYLDRMNAIASENVPGFNMTAYAVPMQNEGMTNHFTFPLTYAFPGELGISTHVENMELACRYWDYCYSDEAFIPINYGPEGTTMYFDDNGDPHYNDFALSPGEPLNSFNGAQKFYMMLDGPFFRKGDRELYDIPDSEKLCGPAWTKGDPDYNLPAITTTADEGERISSIMSDINTYIQETQVKFVTGQMDMSEFDGFIETVKGMGIEEVVEIYQGALERYEARSEVVEKLK